MNLKFLKDKIERLEFLEEQYGIEITTVSFAFTGYSYLYCFYEVHATNLNGNKSDIDIKIDVVVYDQDGDIMGAGRDFSLSIGSIGFAAGKIGLTTIHESNIDQIGKIRIYPRGNT